MMGWLFAGVCSEEHIRSRQVKTVTDLECQPSSSGDLQFHSFGEVMRVYPASTDN